MVAHLWCAMLFVSFKSDPLDCGASYHRWVSGSSNKGALPGQGYKKATIPPHKNPHATFPSLAYIMCVPTKHHWCIALSEHLTYLQSKSYSNKLSKCNSTNLDKNCKKTVPYLQHKRL